MQPAQLNLQSDVSLWRFRLERTLVQALMTDNTQSLCYDIDAQQWLLNGKAVRVRLGVHSKIATFFAYFFHRIRICCSPGQRKRFAIAKAVLNVAQANSMQAISQKNLAAVVKPPPVMVKAECNPVSALNETLANEKQRILAATLHKLEEHDKECEQEIELLKTLNAYYVARQSGTSAECQNLGDALKKYTALRLAPLPKLTLQNLELIIAKTEERIEALQQKTTLIHRDCNMLLLQLDVTAQTYKQRFGAPDSISPAAKVLSKPNESAFVDADQPGIKPVLNAPTQLLLSHIHAHLGAEGHAIWLTLFERFAKEFPDNVESYVESDGSYLLQLRQPMRIWLLSTDENGKEDPIGGIVMSLGSNVSGNNPDDYSIRLNFSPHLMQISHGLEIFVQAPWYVPLITFGKIKANVLMTTAVTEFKALGGQQFSMKAVKYIGLIPFSKARTKSYEQFLDNWGKLGEVLEPEQDPFEVIKTKLHNAIS